MKKILAILQLPPPAHGAGFVGKQIQESEIINLNFSIKYLRISTKSKNKRFKSKVFQFFRYFLLLGRVIRNMFDSSYDLVYITPCASGLEFYKDFIICQLVKSFNKKVVYHFHNKGLDSNRFVPAYFKRVFLRNVNVILLSPLLKYDLGGLVPNHRIYYCPNGVSFNPYQDFNIKEPNYINPVRFLFLSNMIKTKGVFVLLEACNILIERGFDFECVFVGPWYENIENEFYNTVNKYDLSIKVSYLGPKYGDDKISIIKGSDIFVFPTLNDCFPLVLLEAMSFGLPIISTYEGAIPEIVQDSLNGFLVDKNNSKALADSMEKLLINHTLREGMSEESFKLYKEKFTQSYFENTLKEILQEIAK